MHEGAIAGSETLLGQLQRGRGRGYLAAIRAGGGEAELLTCIVHDPRWDQQLEERASYYGRLAVELGLSVDPIAKAVREGDPHDGIGGLPADVLMEMALRGRTDALRALREELRHDGWLSALEALVYAEHEYGRQLLEFDDIGVVAGRDADELKPLFFNHALLPWREWASSQSRLRTLLEEVNAAEKPAPQPPAPNPDTAMSTSELLAIAEPRNGVKVARLLTQRSDEDSIAAMVEAARGADRIQRLAAFRALGAQGNPVLLEEASLLLESDPGGPSRGRRMPILSYLEALPSDETLPRARGWLDHHGGAAIAAEGILALHAHDGDRELVEATLSRALDDDSIYRACSMVKALTVIADPASAPLLVQVFERIPYSWARPRVLRALHASGAKAGQRLACEALWDCDMEARELAAEITPLNDSARARLEGMAADSFEEERVRSAAQERLR
ncbi:MAG: hypothetical protein DRJ42_23770 [Deltaproteobacteria bacterium]|nr:MAG: hypothetical protein DRJ42_23770 [Deltaproteobacteria bacterium]